jgi:hypothetical protein
MYSCNAYEYSDKHAGLKGTWLQFLIASATKSDVCMKYHASRGRHESGLGMMK